MIWLYISLGIVAIVILSTVFYFLTAYLSFRKAFFVSKKNRKEKLYDIPKQDQYSRKKAKMIELINEMRSIPFEWVYITSFDGLRLAARYYHIDDDAPIQIQFHGYRGSAIRDFCGGNKLARELGFNTLVVDQRAHGASDGKVITFGINERYDCLSWINYACERFNNKPIYLAGVSMGAATVLMASELDLPENVKGIIADCPYSSPKAILIKVISDMKLPKKASYAMLKLGARKFGKFDIEQSSAVQAVKNATVPILLIHGESDKFVPCDMSREIAANCNATLVTFPEAGHGISYIVDPSRYKQVVKDFIASTDRI